MGRIIRVEQGEGESLVTMEANLENAVPEGWSRANAVFNGDDGCWVEDLIFKGLDRMAAIDIFACLSPQPLTQSEAIQTIVNRCRVRGVSVVPGDAIEKDDGQWTFRGWRVSL